MSSSNTDTQIAPGNAPPDPDQDASAEKEKAPVAWQNLAFIATVANLGMKLTCETMLKLSLCTRSQHFNRVHR